MNIISLVSYPFLPDRTGGQKGIALFYKYFSAYHAVTCVTTKKNKPGDASGYEVLNILSDSRLRYINPFLFFSLRKLIRKKKASHLILEHPYFGWLGILLKMSTGVKLVVHSHNIEGNRWKTLGKWWWKILWSYEKMTHRHADFNFFIQDEDRKYAIEAFGLRPDKCLTVSFGTEISGPESSDSQAGATRMLRQQFRIADERPILLFNGAFQYTPNREALGNLLYRVNPVLQKRNFHYRLLIIGIDIPAAIAEAEIPDVQVVGYAEDLGLFLHGSQVFLNPVVTGGGIKTKLVEAIAHNLTAVSSESGAVGVDPALCNGKLLICRDNDWEAFAEAIVKASGLRSFTPPSFYEHFYWANITGRAARFIEGHSLK